MAGNKLLLTFAGLALVFFVVSLMFGPQDDGNDPVSSGQLIRKSTSSPAGPATLDRYSLDKKTAVRWKLTGKLQEISGLAMTKDGRLLAHNDEKGTVFEIDSRNGKVVKQFSLSDVGKPVSDDFEGIATVGDRIYLVNSRGRLYEFEEGNDGKTVLYNIFTTGIGRDYEIEGLAYDPLKRQLLLISKNPLRAKVKDHLTIFRWSVDTRQLVAKGHTIISIADFASHLKGKLFQPSGIERHPRSGNYFIIAAQQRAVAEVTPAGQVLSVVTFPADWHRQAEGVTFTAVGTLIVADEGAGKRARLTFYPMSN